MTDLDLQIVIWQKKICSVCKCTKLYIYIYVEIIRKENSAKSQYNIRFIKIRTTNKM